MHLSIIAVGKSMPAWVERGYQEYSKRLPREWRLQLVETTTNKMLAAIPKNNHIIALEINGERWDTLQLAKQLQQWQLNGKDISFLIGGPDGLTPECSAKAHQKWSLSPLTFPHPLVRIILAEQLYRAWSLLAGHPYHK